MYDTREPSKTGGNVHLNGAQPYSRETNPLVLAAADPGVRIEERGENVYLHLAVPPEAAQAATSLVTTETAG